MYFRGWKENCVPGSMLHKSLVAHCQEMIGTEFNMEEVAGISIREIRGDALRAASYIGIGCERYRKPYPLRFSVESVSLYYRNAGSEELLHLYPVRFMVGESLLSTLKTELQKLSRPVEGFGFVAAVIVRSECRSSFDGAEVMSQHFVEMIASISSSKPEW